MATPSKNKTTLCGGNDSNTDNAKESLVALPSSSSLQRTTIGTLKAPITNPMLTPEDWELIFRYIKSKDFESVKNSCPEWNHLLHSRKSTELLPLVLPILIKFDHLTLQDTLNCRKLNKATKSGIDHTIGQEISTPSKRFTNEMNRRCKEDTFTEIEIRRYFCRHMQIDKFKSHVESRPMASSINNPFHGRALFLFFPCPWDQIFNESVSSLLSQYGHHLWSVTIAMCPGADWNTIDTLLSILNLTPNLKMLKIIGIIDLGKLLQTPLVFPALAHLESLDFEGIFNYDIPTDQSIVIPFLVTYGNQLTTFRCRGDLLWGHGLEAHFFNQVAPNVKQLSLIQYFGDTGPIFPLPLDELETFCQLKWPVEHFHLYKDEHDAGYDASAFLRHLNATVGQFSNTLVQLDILVKLQKGEGSVAIMNELKGQVLPKLKIMKSMRSNVLQGEFWSFMKLRCGELRELHLSFCSSSCCTANNHSEMPASMQAFQILPKLDRILFWSRYTDGKRTPVIWTRRDLERDSMYKQLFE